MKSLQREATRQDAQANTVLACAPLRHAVSAQCASTADLLGLQLNLLPHGLGHLLRLGVLLSGLGQFFDGVLQLHLNAAQLVDVLRPRERGVI